MSNSPRPSWKLLVSLLMLALVPSAAGVVRLAGLAAGGAVTTDNARFVAMPWPVTLHIVCAVFFCTLAPFQFDAAIRLRHLRPHRLVGRLLAPAGAMTALTGLWMTCRCPIPAPLQGGLLYGVRMGVGLGMAGAIVASVLAVLQGRIARHRAWMLRAYALGQGAGTQVLVLLPVTWMLGPPTFFLRDVLMASAWGLNMIVVEWVIRRRSPST
jgi:hypothetical protein